MDTESSIDFGHRTATYSTTTNSMAITARRIDTQNVNLLVSEYCEEIVKVTNETCKTYKPPDVVLAFNKILWVNWATSGSISNEADEVAVSANQNEAFSVPTNQ